MMSEYFVPGLFPFGESNRLYMSIIRELLNLCKIYKKKIKKSKKKLFLWKHSSEN